MTEKDGPFHNALAALDAGDVLALDRLLAAHPRLACEPLTAPGPWLRDRVGDALDGFFKDPYLLWFVAEDPVRNNTLPANIADVARAIITAARRETVNNLSEQLDTALRLVGWSWVARECGVQITLIDLLLDAGASVDGWGVYGGRFGTHADSAIYNRNFAAAEHLLMRGATPTLTTTLCLGHWNDAERLAKAASAEERHDALVQAALIGNAEALKRMLALGLDATTVSARNQSHGTALHHAVWSGSLDAVRVLVEAGADLNRRDTTYGATPLGWAEYGERSEQNGPKAERYREIAAWLRSVLASGL